MKTRTWGMGMLLVLVSAAPARAQGYPVIDVANLTQTAQIASTSVQEARTIVEQLGFLRAMAARLQDMDRFRTPPIVATRPDPALFPWALRFIEALNNGDPRDELYRASVRPLPPLGPILDRLNLPPAARRVIESQYADLQIKDAVIPRAVHQNAIIRGFTALDRALEALGDDVTSPRNATHYLSAVMGKVSGALLIQARQAANATQIASGTLEQAIAQNTSRRNDAVSAMNFTLGILESRGSAAAEIADAAEAIAGWTLR